METPIQVLVREIKDEATNACEIYSHLQDKTLDKRVKRMENDRYVESVRRLSELVRAIETLNQHS